MATTTQTRTERIEARLTKEQKERFLQAAALQGRSLSSFVMRSLEDSARRTLAEYAHTPMRLNAADSRAFAELLLHPPKPNAALKRAFAARDKLVRG